RFALARALLGKGERDSAARHVREAWRSEELSERSEAEAFEMFCDLLTSDDHRARMDKRIGAKDFSGALRAARHVGSEDVSIVKACAAATANASNALELLDSIATDARKDLGYALCRIRWLLRHEHFAHIDDGSVNPIVMARACYWRGRAAEAVGENEKMRAEYQTAARHGTAYYGQLARARLGLLGIELRSPPQPLSNESPADELV